MRLDRAIADLLYGHDCVIVPGLGGFIARRIPAKPADGDCFQPARKVISFNEALQSQDGLLANYLAQRAQIAFEAASDQVETQVQHWKRALSNRRRVCLNGIGTLSSNAEQAIEFKPDSSVNYLTDSFGLPSIYAEKIRRQPESGIKQGLRPLRYAALWIPLAALASFSVYELSHRSAAVARDEATLNPFVGISDQTANQKALSKPLAHAYRSALQKRGPRVSELHATPIQPAVSQPIRHVDQGSDIKSHQLIAGAFREIAHAQRLLSDLKRQGYPAQIAGRSGRLTLVAVQSFATKREAMRAYYWIRKKRPEIWYRYKG